MTFPYVYIWYIDQGHLAFIHSVMWMSFQHCLSLTGQFPAGSHWFWTNSFNYRFCSEQISFDHENRTFFCGITPTLRSGAMLIRVSYNRKMEALSGNLSVWIRNAEQCLGDEIHCFLKMDSMWSTLAGYSAPDGNETHWQSFLAWDKGIFHSLFHWTNIYLANATYPMKKKYHDQSY